MKGKTQQREARYVVTCPEKRTNVLELPCFESVTETASEGNTSCSTDLSLESTDDNILEPTTDGYDGLSSDPSGSLHAPSVIDVAYFKRRQNSSISPEEPSNENELHKNEHILALHPTRRDQIDIEPTRVLSRDVLQEDIGRGYHEKPNGHWDQSCRICHDVGSTDLFISPCDCKGSLSLVHKHCLERWLGESNASACELCGYLYHTRREPKYNRLLSVYAFLSAFNGGRERRMLLWDVVSITVFVLLATWCTRLMMAALAEELPPSITGFVMAYTRILQLFLMTITVAFDICVMAWTLIRLQYHVSKWSDWYTRNCRVVLLGYTENKTPLTESVTQQLPPSSGTS